jgi:hypothetical protein
MSPKLLIVLGVALVLAGLLWQFGIKFLPFGKMPGDIIVEKPSFRFYMPLGTSLLLSIFISLIFYLYSWLTRR